MYQLNLNILLILLYRVKIKNINLYKICQQIKNFNYFIFINYLIYAEKFLEKSMKFESSNKAQNLLYKLDTMRRRDVEEK